MNFLRQDGSDEQDDSQPRPLLYLDSQSIQQKLFDRQAQFGMLTGKNTIPERVLAKLEELRITVRQFLHINRWGKKPLLKAWTAPPSNDRWAGTG